ncbi:MAG: gliding-associated putative transporter substrate-binding component GldG [Acidimicrobiales bacterium]|nr:gliding-associated putative transporter substrate-binding component GldG [Acidimicrobiales bacterium]
MRRVIVAVVALVVLLGANVVAYRNDRQIDLSAGSRFTLSPETRSLAKAVRSELKVTAFASPKGGVATDARFLLSRYHQVNRRITFSVVDPDAHPTQAARLGITQYATVVATYQGRRVDAADVDELEISTAILRLLRGKTRNACFVTGHGEPSLDDTSPDGMSQLAAALRHNAYEPRAVDLTKGDVPADCAFVAVAGPTDPLVQREVDAINGYASRAGRVFVMATPASNADPNPLLAPWGVRFAGGLVIDPDRSQNLDFDNVIAESFPSANPVTRGVSRLQLPAGGGLLVDAPKDRPGLTVSRLAESSARAFVETRPDIETTFDALDIPGPVLLATASDDSHVEQQATGEKIVRSRVIAVGDAAWATNRYLGNLSNARFLLNAVNWLAEEEQLVATTSRPANDRPLPLTPERQRRVLIVSVGVVPSLIVAAGVAGLSLRRRRRGRGA